MGPRARRIAVLSVHTCPLAELGGKKTGGMNVYIRELSREMAKQGFLVDIFTRYQDSCEAHLNVEDTPGVRVIHLPAGPSAALPALAIYDHVAEFTQGVLDF